MKIKKITVDGFGLFDGLFDLSFPGDIALVVGDNETGKSTLLRAVCAILFGFRNEGERSVFAPYGAASPRRGSLEIESNGKLHKLSRDFDSNHARIETLGEDSRILFDGSAKPGGRTEEKEAYGDLMRKLVGIDNEDLFTNSVFIEQNSLRPEMEGVVRQIVTGTTSADYTVALKNLKDACEELTLEVPWGRKRKKRRIELLEAELREKGDRLSEIRGNWAEAEETQNRLAAVTSQLTRITESIVTQKAWESDLNSFAQALEESGRLEKQLNEYRSEIREIERLSNDLKEYSDRIQNEYSDYESLSEKAETDMASLAQIRLNQAELEERFKRTEAEAPAFTPKLMIPAGVAGSLILVLAILLFDGALTIAGVLIGAGIFAWPLISAAFALNAQKTAHEGKLREITDQLNNLKNQSAEVEDRHPVLKNKNPMEALDALREFKRLKQEAGEKEAALKQHPDPEQINAEFDSLSNEFLRASGKLDDLKSRRPSLADVEQAGRTGKTIEKTQAEIRQLEEQNSQHDKEQDELRLKLAAMEATQTTSEEALEEEVSEKQSELEQLKLSREAHLIAIKALDEAVSEFRSSHLTRIEKKTSDYLENITGAPCRACLDEKLDPLGIERDGQLCTPTQLSQGARDQLHFALRIASVEEISGSTRLPIILDDPFVNFDESRLKATLDMLSTLSESHQVILFTHDRRFSEWREPVRVLEG